MRVENAFLIVLFAIIDRVSNFHSIDSCFCFSQLQFRIHAIRVNISTKVCTCALYEIAKSFINGNVSQISFELLLLLYPTQLPRIQFLANIHS